MPGNFNVLVFKSFVDEDDVEHHLLPERYLSADSSQLTANVMDGNENDFTFDLTD